MHTFAIGWIECSIVSDGRADYEPEGVFASVDRSKWEPLVAARLNAVGLLSLPYQPTLVNTAGARVVIDAGTGADLAEEWGEPVGRMAASLDTLGCDPETVSAVVITHAHPDHVGGLTVIRDGSSVPMFANARHLLAEDEWEFWFSPNLPEPSSHMAPLVQQRLMVLAEHGLVDLFTGEFDIADGIHAFPTPGHTPGHLSVMLTSNDRQCFVAGDAILTEWSFEHPDWCADADVDPRSVVESRIALLRRAVQADALITAYHVDGVGHARRAGNVWTFDAEDQA